MTGAKRRAYRAFQRWHFYAGMLVWPIVVLLSLTGSIYLFKPQVEQWEERAWRDLPGAPLASPMEKIGAAKLSFPDAEIVSYRIPLAANDAVLVHMRGKGEGGKDRDVFVSPDGKVVGMIPSEARLMQVIKRLHGQLLLGPKGSWLVEIVASWTIFMILSGLFLWWPRGRGAAGVLWPRLSNGKTAAMRDLHAVAGFWVSGLALVLLLTGLPWTDVWGHGFKAIRAEMGWVKGEQPWTIGGRAAASAPAGHDHAAMMRQGPAAALLGSGKRSPFDTASADSFNGVVKAASGLHLAFPVLVSASPSGRSDADGQGGIWVVKSDSGDRTQRVTVTFDKSSGRQLSQSGFADSHAIDRVIGYGISWHEGQLFGPVNVGIGVATAVLLLVLNTFGVLMWIRRKPPGLLGAPLAIDGPSCTALYCLLSLLSVLLPLFLLSLAALLLIDLVVLRYLPGAALWLGVSDPSMRHANGDSEKV